MGFNCLTNITFNDMPYDIKYTVLQKMECSAIVKMWYNFPSTHNIIQDYLNKNNFDTIDTYILTNLDKYVDIKTRDELMKFPQRLCYMFMFFECGYYNYPIKYCTIEDDEQFNNFVKLIKFNTYIEDAFNLVIENDKEMVDKFILLSYNTNLSKENMYKMSYNLDYNQIYKYIEMHKNGYYYEDIMNNLN